MGNKVDLQAYVVRGSFNKIAFADAYRTEFKSVPKYNAASVPDLVQMLEMMEQDPTITDVRWMAYMLATAFIESSTTVKETRTSKDKKGHPVTRTVKLWRNFAPIDEKGHGHSYRYGRPVKVKLLASGSVRVTEYDGDQWTVSPGGQATPVARFEKMGVTPGGKANGAYLKDDGEEKVYYGRGYVQLTWWSNYAATGVLLGMGLDLLLDPDLVHEPKLAYKILSTGMRTGEGFANGHTFAQFFNASTTDYVHARSMVNGTSGQHEVGAIAERFEKVLLGAVQKPLQAVAK